MHHEAGKPVGKHIIPRFYRSRAGHATTLPRQVTMCSGNKNVDYAIFVVATPFRHRGLTIFCFFLVSEAPLRCRVAVVACPALCKRLDKLVKSLPSPAYLVEYARAQFRAHLRQDTTENNFPF